MWMPLTQSSQRDVKYDEVRLLLIQSHLPFLPQRHAIQWLVFPFQDYIPLFRPLRRLISNFGLQRTARLTIVYQSDVQFETRWFQSSSEPGLSHAEVPQMLPIRGVLISFLCIRLQCRYPTYLPGSQWPRLHHIRGPLWECPCHHHGHHWLEWDLPNQVRDHLQGYQPTDAVSHDQRDWWSNE